MGLGNLLLIFFCFEKSGDKKTTIKNGDKKVTKKTQMQYDKILEFMEKGTEYGIWDFCDLLGLKESRTKDILKELSTQCVGNWNSSIAKRKESLTPTIEGHLLNISQAAIADW